VIEAAIRSILVAALVAVAALCAELALRRMRLPTRLVWMLAAATIPGLALWPPHLEHSLTLIAVSATSVPAHTSVTYRWFWPMCSLLAMVWTLGAALRLNHLIKGRPTIRLNGIELIVADDLGPAVVGLFAPRVIVPKWFGHLPTRAQRLVLVHELTHLKALDPWVLGATLLAALSMPWNPLQWWIVRRARRAIEVDCDERVLARGIPVRHYGEALIDVAARPLRSLGPATVICAMSDFLERRILIMTIRHRSPHVLPTLLILSAALTAAAGAVLADSPPADTDRAAKLEAEAAAAQAAEKQYAKREAEAAEAQKRAAEAAELEALARKQQAENGPPH